MQIIKTNRQFSDFPVGTDVKIVCQQQDFYFFYGETGKVVKNSGHHLGIIVKFDVPRHFEGGYIQETFNFSSKDLDFKNSDIDWKNWKSEDSLYKVIVFETMKEDL